MLNLIKEKLKKYVIKKLLIWDSINLKRFWIKNSEYICEKYKNNVNNVKKISSRNRRSDIIEIFNKKLLIFSSF